MNKQVVIIGASGHGKVVADIVRLSGDTVVGFLDDDPGLPPAVCGIPCLGAVSRYRDFPGAEFIIAIGNAAIRQKIAGELENVTWYTAIHPSAVISALDASIGEGTVIAANAVVNPGATVGAHCIVNTGAIVEHDNVLGDFVHVSVGAKLGGTVRVGARTWIGIGATVKNNLSVCGDCMIGAGAVVVKNIDAPGTYTGVPAGKRK